MLAGDAVVCCAKADAVTTSFSLPAVHQHGDQSFSNPSMLLCGCTFPGAQVMLRV